MNFIKGTEFYLDIEVGAVKEKLRLKRLKINTV